MVLISTTSTAQELLTVFPHVDFANALGLQMSVEWGCNGAQEDEWFRSGMYWMCYRNQLRPGDVMLCW